MCIPNPYTLIITATDDGVPILTESYGPHSIIMTLQHFETLSCLRIPKPNSLIVTATGYDLPIETKGH